jgi:putative peptidoglycan lipid II flippase
MLITGLINGIDMPVLIPEFIRLREQENNTAAQQFINLYIWLYGILGAVFVGIGLFNINILFSTISKFDAHTIIIHQSLLTWALALPPLMLLCNLFASILNAYKYFSISVLVNLINSLSSLVLLVYLHESMGVMGGVIGLVVGYAINVFLLGYLIVTQLQWQFFFVSWHISPMIKKLIISNYAITFPILARNYIVPYLLSGQAAGILTAVNWGLQIAAIPDTLILGQLLNVISVRFSEFYAQQKQDKALVFFYQIFKGLHILYAIIFCLFYIYADTIATILLQYKSAQNIKIEVIAHCIALFAAVPFMGLSSHLISRLLIAFQLLHKSITITSISQTLLIGLLYVGITFWSYQGYALFNLLGLLIHSLLLYWLSSHLLKQIDIHPILQTLGVVLGIVVVLLPALWVAHYYLNTYLYGSMTMGLFVCMLAIGVVYRKEFKQYLLNA